MSEEEKEAIKDSKDIIKELNKNKDKDFIGRLYYKNKPIEDILQILVNLVEKQQKELEDLRNPIICGRNIDEIVNILNGLDLEKATNLEVTMENLKSFMAIYQKEVEDSLHNATTELISGISGTGARIEFQIPHYDFLKKEE